MGHPPKRRPLALLLATALLVGPLSARSPGGDNQLPQELRNLAVTIGCEAVPGFYDRPGMIDPPYLYGYLPGNKEETAAFWCYRKQAKESYLLVFVEGLGQARQGRVTSTIPWSAFPGGLSRFDTKNVYWYDSEGVRLSDSEHLPLSEFRYVDNPKEHGPEEKTTKYTPVQAEYDGVVVLFYQDGDRWLFKVFH